MAKRVMSIDFSAAGMLAAIVEECNKHNNHQVKDMNDSSVGKQEETVWPILKSLSR